MTEELTTNRSLDPGHELAPSVRQELANAEPDVPQLLDRLARLQADFENARKRAAKEKQEFQEYALFDAVKTLLPVLDSFERALRSSALRDMHFQNGIGLIYKQLLDALVKLGVRPIHAEGGPFDPAIHHAVHIVESHEVKDQQVLEELQRGYKFKDRLLRPAMVTVARNSGG